MRNKANGEYSPSLPASSSGHQRRELPCPAIITPSIQVTDQPPDNPVRHWVQTYTWPEEFPGAPIIMSPSPSRSTHPSSIQERLEYHRIYSISSDLLQEDSRDLCHSFLAGEEIPNFPGFPGEKIAALLELVASENEARIERDITSWIVPSTEMLFLNGDLAFRYIGEELHADWTRCETMGSTRPNTRLCSGTSAEYFCGRGPHETSSLCDDRASRTLFP
jgi:hypothetical protein